MCYQIKMSNVMSVCRFDGFVTGHLTKLRYSLSHSWTLWRWERRLEQCRLQVAAEPRTTAQNEQTAQAIMICIYDIYRKFALLCWRTHFCCKLSAIKPNAGSENVSTTNLRKVTWITSQRNIVTHHQVIAKWLDVSSELVMFVVKQA